MELVILNLFAEVNYSATANNVDRFLSKQLPRLLRRCGHDLIDLSSPKLSWAPSHSTGHNYAETSIVSALSIEQVIKAIYKSIYSCSKLHKTVLIDNYVYCYDQEQIIRMLPYEKSQYYNRIKPDSLLEFADAYDYYQQQCDVDDDNLVDLRVYA